TSLTVADASDYLSGTAPWLIYGVYVRIDNEIIKYGAKSGNVLSGLTRAQLGTAAASHAAGAAVVELVRIGPAHPIDVVKFVLQNTDKTGVSMPTALIDLIGLANVRAAIGSSFQMDFYLTAAANAKAWLEQQIYQPLGLYPTTDRQILAAP